MDRRDFLKGIGAGAAGAAFVPVWSAVGSKEEDSTSAWVLTEYSDSELRARIHFTRLPNGQIVTDGIRWSSFGRGGVQDYRMRSFDVAERDPAAHKHFPNAARQSLKKQFAELGWPDEILKNLEAMNRWPVMTTFIKAKRGIEALRREDGKWTEGIS